ncbi:MAG: Unknown protein [uncultured Thiotrichaceae bacterium]|uniref:CBM-cenC domain-containing protein n=1 Tax=uncultured Thiotrichaceae bacterium TaxID=298394 RepID=A0A6S6U5V0_9GAMM|nr:MAG: Unknown protein [uncultured Thiotrichaceae bacterium]
MKIRFVLKFLFVTVCFALLYRILGIYLGISANIYNAPKTTQHLESIIAQNPKHSFALERLAKQAFDEKRYNISLQLAQQALLNNPSSGHAASILLQLYKKSENYILAEHASILTYKLWPSHALSLIHVADYEHHKGNYAKAIQLWDAILTQNIETKWGQENKYKNSIFPVLENALANANTSHHMDVFFASPPTWWNDFFRHISTQTHDIATLRTFYEKTIESQQSFPKDQRLTYFQRLIRENYWKEAYDLWLNGLQKQEIPFAQNIFDGGFEGARFNEGFSWRLAPKSNVQVYKDRLSRTSGESSLKISFTSWIDDYWGYVNQLIYLSPGEYTLQLKSRSSLRGQKGMRWIIRCARQEKYLLDNEAKVLGTTTAIRGDTPWSNISMTFIVPEANDCKAQVLSLIHAGGNAEENRVRGDLWFDDIAILSKSKRRQK